MITMITMHIVFHPELSGCITTLTVRNTGGCKLCAAMDTLIDQDDSVLAFLQAPLFLVMISLTLSNYP